MADVVHQLVEAKGGDKIVITKCGLKIPWKSSQPLPEEVTAWTGSVTCADCRG